MPVDEKQEMPEGTRFSPCSATYFNSAVKSSRSRQGTCQVIFMCFGSKKCGELEITDKGYFADVNIEYYRAAEQQSTIPKRHADICITAPETGSPFLMSLIKLFKMDKGM